MDYPFERCEETDPNRCQGVDSTGQCRYKAIPGTTYCPRHGVNKQLESAAKKRVSMYRLQQYQERVDDFANNPEIKNLREEIGITRMVLENIINKCKNANRLLIHSDKISALVGQVRVLVESCQKLEEKNNKLLDRKIVLVIADNFVTILSKYMSDPDQLQEIGAELVKSIEIAASAEDQFGAESQSGN